MNLTYPLVVLVCGGRDYRDAAKVDETLVKFAPDRIVHGDCPTGADRLARLWAVKYFVPEGRYPANWKKYKRAAGPIRNAEMLEKEPLIQLCIAFPGGDGTADMVAKCEKAGIQVWRVS